MAAREADESTPLLSSGRGRHVFPDQFVGLWQCRELDFYSGSIIEIGESHWCPLRPKAAVSRSATYKWSARDGFCELIEDRGPGDRRVYNLRQGPAGTLEVRMLDKVWYLDHHGPQESDEGEDDTARTYTDMAGDGAILNMVQKQKTSEAEMLRKTLSATSVPPAFLVLTALLLALCFFMMLWVEEWHILTSVYALTQCVLTIGFGDFTITHDVTKLALSFLMICSLVIVAFVANEVGDVIVRRHLQKASNNLSEYHKQVMDSTQLGPEPRKMSTGSEERRLKDMRNSFGASYRLVAGTWPTVACLAFGTVFYATYEACTCSYGSSQRPGCSMDSYEECARTGGYTKTWIDAFYMSVMALTTVGIGDFSPRSELGRGVAIVWLPLGVASAAYTIRELSTFFFNQRQEQVLEDEMMTLTRSEFNTIDSDGSGQLSRMEYRWFLLLKHDLLPLEVIKQIDHSFDHLSEGTGYLEYSMLEAAKKRRLANKLSDSGGSVQGDTPRSNNV